MRQNTQGGFLISQIKQIQGRIFERLLRNSGVEDFNGAQGRILFVLWQQDCQPIHELSRKTSLAKTTLTSMLDRMERLGYVERAPDDGDRRQIRIRLTQKARDQNDRYKAVSEQMAEIFYRGFEDNEIARFEAALDRILANLKEHER